MRFKSIFHDFFSRLGLPLFCLLLALLMSQPALAQQRRLAMTPARELKFEHLSIEHGLSQTTVNCFLQDQQGFIWVGTNDGLNRFDDYQFLHYRHLPGDSISISNNTINVIYESCDGTLWIGTNGGLNQFDHQTETFRHLRHDANNPQSLDDNRVRAIYEDRAGILWVGTHAGLNKFDWQQRVFKHYFPTPGSSAGVIPAPVFAIAEHKSPKGDELLVGTWGSGVYRFDRATEIFTRCFADHLDPRLQAQSWVSVIYVDREGDLWVVDGNVYKYDSDRGALQLFYRAQDDFATLARALHREKSGRWLVGTWGRGLLLWDHDWRNARSLQHDPNDPGSLSDDGVQTLFEDRDGETWLGTTGGGISKYDPQKKNSWLINTKLKMRTA